MGEALARKGKEEVYTGIWWENLRERDHLKVPGLDGSALYYGNREVGWWGMNCIDLNEDRERWWAPVNAKMTSGSIKCGKFIDYLRTG